MAGIFDFIKDLFKKKKKPDGRGTKDKSDTGGFSFIDKQETYEFCFHDEAFLIILGGRMEVEFNKKFIGLEDEGRSFFLDYTENMPGGASNTKTIELSLEGQKVIFSKESIFRNQGIPADAGFQLYTRTNVDGEISHVRNLKGFMFPSDEELKEQIKPVLSIADEVLREETRRIFFDPSNRAFKGEDFLSDNIKSLLWDDPNGQAENFHEWITAFRAVMLEEIRAAMASHYGYVFDDNLKDWLSRNIGFRA